MPVAGTRRIIKLLFTAILFFFSSCKKNKLPVCEKWEVKYEYFNIGACIDFSCAGSRTMQLNFCDKDLEEAKVGYTKIVSQDQCCKRTMTFIRKL